MNFLLSKTGFAVIGLFVVFIFGYFLVNGAFGSTLFGVTIKTNPNLASGLIAQWNFSEVTPITDFVSDESGNNRYGTSSVLRQGSSDVSVDTSTAATNAIKVDTPNSTLVWINNDEGFMFYNDQFDSSAMASTSDGGATWGNFQQYDSNSNNIIEFGVWYDRWTPGRGGDLIHIVSYDLDSDDTWYTQYNTITDQLSTTVVTGTGTATISAGDVATITVAEDGAIYVAAQDESDSWVHSCASSCTTGVNWSALTNPFTSNAQDYVLLFPFKDTDNVMLLWWDTSANDLLSNVYSATSSSWWGWVTLDGSVEDNTIYTSSSMGATFNPETGNIYWAVIADANNYTTQDHDLRVWEYDRSSYTWSEKTAIFTNVSGGLSNTSITIDENTGELYVIYSRLATISDADSADIYYVVSNDNGDTWSDEQGPFNGTGEAQRAVRTSTISNERIGVVFQYDTLNDFYYRELQDIGEYPSDKVTPGILGQGMEFDGDDDYIYMAHDTIYDSTNMTISAWLYLDNLTPAMQLVNKAETADTNGWYFAYEGTASGGGVSVSTASSGCCSVVETVEQLPLRTWIHATAVFTDTDVDIYLDGALATSSTVTMSRTATTEPVRIGAEDASGDTNNFHGRMDDIRMYDRALSAGEVKRIYELGATTKVGKTLGTNLGLENGLVGHWSFDGSSVDVTTGTTSDQSTSGNDGVLSSTIIPATSVDRVGSWSSENLFTTNGFTYTPGAGTNRIALVMVSGEHDNTGGQINFGSATLGGQTLTSIGAVDGTVVGTGGGYHNVVWLGYLLEDQITSMSGNTLLISWDTAPNEPFDEIKVQAATYENVNQSSPIADSAENTNTSALSIQAGSVSVGEGDRFIYATIDGQPANHTADSGYTEQIEQDGAVNDMSAASVERDATTSGSVNPTATWDVTSRLAIISAVLDLEGGSDSVSSKLSLGKLGQAVKFNGATDYIDWGSVGGGIQTIAFWVRFSTTTTSMNILEIDGTDKIETDSGGNIVATSFPNATIHTNGSSVTTKPNVGEWMHVVVTDSTGVNLSSFTTGSTTKYFGGSLDDIRIFNRELSVDEINRLYGLGATTKIGKTLTTNPDLENGLVLHWSFDGKDVDLDATSAEILDRSASELDGNWQNHGDTTRPGKLGQAIDLDGTNDYISVADNAAISGLSALTWSAWVWWDEQVSDASHILAKGNDTSQREFRFRNESSGNVTFMISNDGNTASVANSIEVPNTHFETNQWYHVVGTYDDANSDLLQLYIDGELYDTATGESGGIFDGSAEFVVGDAGGGTGVNFDGRVDDVRVYNRVLSADEVIRLYHLGN